MPVRFIRVSGCIILSRKKVGTFVGIFRELPRLRKIYGAGKWRKRKGIAELRLSDGDLVKAEIHWYEASGIGKKEFKIKRYVE